MVTATHLPIEERLLQLLQHLGIERAHFAARHSDDWQGLATLHPERIASLTLVCPSWAVGLDPTTLHSFSSRLLVFTGDQGPLAERVGQALASLPEATLITLRDYSNLFWTDVIADRTDEIGSALLDFLTHLDQPQGVRALSLAEGEGEVAGITYQIQGSGPPLVLLPLLIAPSQWEPLLPTLSQQYCTITLGGAELGSAAVLEARGRAPGYLRMVRTLMDEILLQPGATILDVGCGTGALDRWLARRTGGTNPILTVDISRYLLREATALARKEGLAGTIEFREGSVETLPFPDQHVEVTLSVTVMEEVNADRMLAEMV
ncbi:MAG: methyltransferase domain-containing protein, partial [Candidatus Tectomicrobia bacterium]|nr:methyltransferase domain-containing protein [Candidatus Tectomicrobia bacterium]